MEASANNVRGSEREVQTPSIFDEAEDEGSGHPRLPAPGPELGVRRFPMRPRGKAGGGGHGAPTHAPAICRRGNAIRKLDYRARPGDPRVFVPRKMAPGSGRRDSACASQQRWRGMRASLSGGNLIPAA